MNNHVHGARVLLSLIAGGLGGAAFFWLSLPLPWMLGSMLVVSAGAMGGMPFRRSVQLRKAMIAVMGLLLGSYFSADILSQLGLWSLAALLVSAYVILMTGFSLAVFRRFGRMDLPTAYFSSMPGGLGPMSVMEPRRILNNCGSSSILYFRIIFPTLVIRGSSLILKTGPLCSLR